MCGCVCVCVQATMALDYRIIDKHVRRHLQSGGAQFTHVQRPETTDISRHPYNGGVRVTGWGGVGLNSHLIVCARVCVCVGACACACVCVCTLRLYWQKIKINSKCLIWYRDSDFLVVFVVFVNL